MYDSKANIEHKENENGEQGKLNNEKHSALEILSNMLVVKLITSRRCYMTRTEEI